jgi:hypothetical protein
LLGLLALAGLTACGDKVTVPAATTTPVDNTVHGVTVSPPSATMNVGDKVTFAASVNAGAGVTDRTVVWTTSNTNVITVDNTGAVTAKANGTASVIATSHADPTQSGAAVVTVGSGTGAIPTITVATVNQTICGALGQCNSVPANLANVFGQIDVTFNVDPAGQKLSEVDLILNCTGTGNSGTDTIVAKQTITSGNVVPAASAAAAPVTLSYNTATFNATNGATAFKNGPCQVKGKAITLAGTAPTTTTSASTLITLNNADLVIVATPLTTTPTAPQIASAVDANGLT